MDTFFSRLSADELDMISYMREAAAYDMRDSEGEQLQPICSNEYFLRYWEAAKAENVLIRKIFDNKLIQTKRVTVQEDPEETIARIQEIISSHRYRQLTRDIMYAVRCYNKENWYVYKIRWENHYTTADGFNLDCYWNMEQLLDHFFNSSVFIQTNIYNGPTFSFNISNDKVYTLQTGAKTNKAFVKIAQAFINYIEDCGDDELTENLISLAKEKIENLRVKLSTVRNQAKFNTPLCLSIHPLDYLTASVNENNWRSCMNFWDGEFRRGVIEMMNSPYVIVAYTPSEHEELYLSNESYWNSKKWREFFIVHPAYGIYGIKGYPYWNKTLEKTTLNWIKEILGFENYHDIQTHTLKEMLLRFSCGPAMYNDFYGYTNTYSFITPVGYAKTVLKDKSDNTPIEIDYSGKSECIICGEEGDFDSEQDLACTNCFTRHYCFSCGEIITPEDTYYHNDHEYCLACYDNLARCEICDNAFEQDRDLTNEMEGAIFGIGTIENSQENFIEDYGYENTEGFTRARCFCTCASCMRDFIAIPEDAIDEAPSRNHWYQCIPLIRPTRFRSYNDYKRFVNKIDSSLLPRAISLYIRDKKKLH